MKIFSKQAVGHLKSGLCFRSLFYTSSVEALELVGVPKGLRKQEKKPFLDDINELKREARLGKRLRREAYEIPLKAPENGLLVKSLIPVAHEVYAARIELIACASRIINHVPVYMCSICREVHVGPYPHKIRTCSVSGSLTTKEHNWTNGGVENILPVVETFHLYDRGCRAVSHNEKLVVDRIPAIVELCIQAGVDLPEYPTRRRSFPVYSISGKIIDFEKKFPRDVHHGIEIEASGFWQKSKRLKPINSEISLLCLDLQDIARRGMKAWEKMRSGSVELMEKYSAQTCGYCSEVQVGPKGHRARICQAYKHQLRDGQHSWQKASVDDLIPPIYVWHWHGHETELMIDRLKRYYGKLPAVVKLFAHVGAPINVEYAELMREGIVVPDLDEEKLVV